MDSCLPEIKIFEIENSNNVSIKQNCGYLTPKVDRFIPNRTVNDLEKSHHLITEKSPSNSKVLNFSAESEPHKKLESSINYSFCTPRKADYKRKVLTRCSLVLDAPDVKDDFYLNLLDWSDSKVLAVGLGKDVYLWNHITKQSKQFLTIIKGDENRIFFSGNYVTSLKWINNDTLAIGSDSLIEIWDVNYEKCVHRIYDHLSRVTCMETNNMILTSGSDMYKKILNHDIRMKTKINEFWNSDFICGLKWNPNSRFLASSGYSGGVFIWDIVAGFNKPKLYSDLNEHSSNVKALSWCPWQSNLLVSGGGKLDGKINFWNVYNGKVLKSIQTDAQVTGIVWSKKHKEILYSRNSDSHNLVIASYPSLKQITELSGHIDRIISMSISSDEVVASLSADESVRFWDCFKNDGKIEQSSSDKMFSRYQNIR